MTFWVYILECADASYYTGHTDNLDKRLYEHARGAADSYTSVRRPVKLVYCEKVETRLEALSMERQIKGWSRAKKKAMIAGDWAEVSRLAKSKTVRPSTGSGRTESETER